jgi:hypothetical protein
MRHFGYPLVPLAQLPDEGESATGTVARDVVADRLGIRLGERQSAQRKQFSRAAISRHRDRA